MLINRENYEAFAIDYLEGNMSGDELQEMESFLEKFPEIKEEIQQLHIVPLTADPALVYGDKQALLKPAGVGSVNKAYLLSVLFIILIGSFGLFYSLKSITGEEPREVLPPANPIESEEPRIPKEVRKSDIALEKNSENAKTEPGDKSEISSLNTIARKGEKKENQNLIDPRKARETQKAVANSTIIFKNEIEADLPTIQIVEDEKQTPQPDMPDRANDLNANPESEIAIELEQPGLESKNPENVETVFEDISEFEEQGIELVLATAAESVEPDKKRRIRLFSNLKERLSKENIANALLPEAFTSNNGN